MTALFTAMLAGDWRQAGQIQRQLTPKMAALFHWPSPAPVKAKLAEQGLLHNITRLPILPLTADETQQLTTRLEARA